MKPSLLLKFQIAILTTFAASVVYGNEQFTVNRSLNWNDSTYFYFAEGGPKYEVLYFEGAAFNYEESNPLPVWGESFPVANRGTVSAEIVNPVYSEIKRQDLVKRKFASAKIEINSFFTVARGKNLLNISFIPIRENAFTGKLEKLVSFTLQISVQPSSSGYRSESEHTYAAYSKLKNGTWYKFGVSKEGVYKIDKTFLTTIGIDPASMNPDNLGVFGFGGLLPEANADYNNDDLVENPVYRSGLDDGSFDDGDYILFYAQGPQGWKFNPADDSYTHQKHLYSDVSYYFISPDQGEGKTILFQSNNTSSTYYETWDYDALVVWDNEKNNLIKSGRRWFDTQLDVYEDEQTFSATIPFLNSTEGAKLKAFVAGKSNVYTPSITLSGTGLNTTATFSIVAVSTENDYASKVLLEEEFELTSGDVNFTAEFNGLVGDVGWVDYIELAARANIKYDNAQLIFKDGRGVGSGDFTRYHVDGPDDIIIWDITNPVNVYSQAFSYDASNKNYFTLPSDSLKTFLAFKVADAFSSAELIPVGQVANQDLHDITKTPDYIIISHPAFVSEARRLAAWHYETHAYDTLVVTTEQVYNEFSSGTQDITAIRNFMRMFYDRAAGDENLMPDNLLIVGDASYDYKNISYTSENNTNFVPTYQSYESTYQTSTFPTDDYFVCLDADEGADMSDDVNILDMGIGRFPVKTVEEAAGIVDKVIHYKSPATFGNWRNTICFIADDEDNNTHIDDADDIAVYIDTTYSTYNLNKIYIDAYQQVPGAGGERYPDVNIAINNQIFTGALVINWAGHGNEQNWAQERILSIDDINGWTNFDKLPFFITATCSFSRFDNPDKTSAGEQILLNSAGGGIGLVSTVRIVYSSANFDLNINFNKKAFASLDGKMPTLGYSLMTGKNAVNPVYTVNKRKFILFADPGIQLNYPLYNVKTTEVDGMPITTADTLKALERVTIKGLVTDADGSTLSDFNGTVYPTVYDKPVNVTTLENDPGNSSPYTFKLQKNIIYKGKASVVNGAFEYTFVVPKDISYDYGNGKLSYYADNGFIDAAGAEFNVLIGGTDDDAPEDNTGPSVDVFMNDESFVFGGLTDENPLLYIKLQDENGINTVGNGIGHDISSTLDENQQTETRLNDYYEAELDNYQQGSVSYPLRDLTPGRHTISVKAWDVYNNSGEGYTEFVVAESADLALDHVLNYPNPFTTSTSFWFEHNRPGDVLDVKVEIFTVSGKMVKTIQQQVITDGYRVSDITWDGLDTYGDQIGKGVYVYKLTVMAESDRSKANEFQKLVILR
ncbi:MAG: type IX secretion system sortase PorU [Chitinophagales bacterium]